MAMRRWKLRRSRTRPQWRSGRRDVRAARRSRPRTSQVGYDSADMARMTGGQALVKTLEREGTRVVFGLPGVQLYGVMAALRDEKAVRFIATRHEQAIGYMADGYARAGGGYGVGLVVPGPGLLNTTAGLSTAYAASSPVLMISGQVPRANIGKDVGVLHEVNDQLDAIAPVTKWRKRVVEIRDVPAAVQDAVRQLKTGRPRPVEIELPPETMEDEDEVELLDPLLVVRAGASAHDVERAVSLLLAAIRPVIYAGGGVHGAGAHQAVADVAEYLQAGVVQSAEGKGAVSDHNDLSLGASIYPQSLLKKYLEQADVILAVGSRCALAGFKPEQPVIQIDVDPDEIGRNHRKTFGLEGDARVTLEQLLERLRAATPPRPSRKTEREALRAEIAATLTQEPQASITRSLRSGIPEDAIVVAMRADTPTDVGVLVTKALTLERPVLIEIPVGRMPRPVFFPPRRKPTRS